MEKKGYTATARNLPMSAKKVRPLADNVRNKGYTEVSAILSNLPHKGARLLKKVIDSAAANAMYHNKKLDEDMVLVKTIMVDEGPSQKRVWARGRGRADRLIKRSCHIFVEVDEKVAKGE